jgi:hypothetical protein
MQRFPLCHEPDPPRQQGMIKVVRYGINLACFHDAKTVQLVERQFAKQ